MLRSFTLITLLTLAILAGLASSHGHGHGHDRFQRHGRFKWRAEQEKRGREAALQRRNHTLAGRADFDGACDAGQPCPNGACCSTNGFCGYGVSCSQSDILTCVRC